MLTNARINDELRPAQLRDWISALRAPQIKALVNEGALQLSLFDEQDLVEISSPEFPRRAAGVLPQPRAGRGAGPQTRRAVGRHRKRARPIAAATARDKRPLRGKDKIALRVGKVINHYNMAEHFTLEITDESFTFTRNTEAIAAEAALDGIYVLRADPEVPPCRAGLNLDVLCVQVFRVPVWRRMYSCNVEIISACRLLFQ